MLRIRAVALAENRVTSRRLNRRETNIERHVTPDKQAQSAPKSSIGEHPKMTLEAYVKSRVTDPDTSWSPDWKPGSEGYEVPYKFSISTSRDLPTKDDLKDIAKNGDLTYTSFIGNRFPTLETTGHYRYWREKGLERLLPKLFPIHLPTYRRIDPAMRAYIHWLHTTDPARFTVRKIAERYGIKERSIEKIIKDVDERKFLYDSGLIDSYADLQITKGQKILDEKEKQFAKSVGYELIGNQDIDDEREIGEDYDGWTSTHDAVRLQAIEVEQFSAFALQSKRNPLLKRVDVDLPVAHTKTAKIVNWIDPNDKVVF